jgi:hypothetical protein
MNMSNSEVFFFDNREKVQFVYATGDEEPPWIRATYTGGDIPEPRVYIWRGGEQKFYQILSGEHEHDQHIFTCIEAAAGDIEAILETKLGREKILQRPLFGEPTDDIERIDAWEGPVGFMIGGMVADIPLQQLGQDYYDAAFLLTKIIQSRDCEDFRIANPTLFLYRHSIELILKAAIGKKKFTHRLEDLAKEFTVVVKRELNEDVPSWIIARIKELAKIDPGSTAFRYAESKGAEDGCELYVDLLYLQSTMKALNTTLIELCRKMGVHNLY